MFTNMWGIVPTIFKIERQFIKHPLVRHRYRLRGKPPGVAKTLEQKLAIANYEDPRLAFKVDIGLPPPQRSRREDVAMKMKLMKDKRADSNLEKAARNLTLVVPTEAIRTEWLHESAPQDIKKTAEHYGIYQDLFGDAYFIPYVQLDIGYVQDNKMEAPVCRGNVVKPAEAKTAPKVSFKSEGSDLWTLVLSNPDGNLIEDKKEVVHWFVGNIPGCDVSKGEVIWDYLQPFPPRGVGFQRLVFVLYKQEGRVDYSALRKDAPCVDLRLRTFETLEFYRERQAQLTPAGLAFFQSDWDLSVRTAFHTSLAMEEPVFEYDHEPRKFSEQRWFPKRKAFNMYLDNYRDPRDVAYDFLLKKLKQTNPFERPKKPFHLPNIYKFDRTKTASWIITERRRERLGLGRQNLQKDDDYD